MSGERLRLVANPTNQRILTVLAVEPSYARRIAGLLGCAESDVSRRLRALKEAGLLKASWERAPMNVRMYSLRRSRWTLRLGPTGPVLEGGRKVAPDAPALPAAALGPPTPAGFVGRAQALKALDEGDHPVVLIEGLPGMGKTSLLARHTEGTDPLWITCRGAESLRWVANLAALHLAGKGDPDLLHAMDEGRPAAQIAALLLDGLDRPGTVTVLDDAHLIEDADLRAFLSDAIDRYSRGRLLLASRQPLPHSRQEGVLGLRLEGLPREDVRTFLEQKGFEATGPVLDRVMEEVGGHPLALHLLTEAARSGGLEPLLDRRPERELTDYLLEEIDAGLSDAQRAALSHASLFAHVFHRNELEALSGRPLEGPLLTLRRRHLVVGSEDGMRLHEVVRNFYHSRLQDLTRLHQEAARACLDRASVDGRLEALHHLLEAGDRDAVLELLEEDIALHDYHFVDAGYHRLYSDVLSHFGRDDVGDEARWAQIVDERGDLAFHRQDWAEARRQYEEAAAGFETAGETERWCDTAWKRALCHVQEGDSAPAETLCRQVLQRTTDQVTRDRAERILAGTSGPEDPCLTGPAAETTRMTRP